MNILILHRVPYHKIDYHRGIDHNAHNVFYIGLQESLKNIPDSIRCHKIIRKGIRAINIEVLSFIKNTNITFDHVISLSEYELLEAAKVRGELNIPGATIKQVEKVRNKIVMKDCIHKAGLKAPHFLSVDALLDSEKNHAWSGKTVLKPIDGASSENVKVFNSLTEVRTRLLSRSTGIDILDNKKIENTHFEIEEFIEGPIIHIDGLVHRGKILACLASRYVGNCLDYAKGKPVGSVQMNSSFFVEYWTLQCLKAVGLTEGSFHLEAIQSRQGLVFLEIGNRVGGADVVKTFELATKIHLPSVELALATGQEVTVTPSIASHEKYGWFVFPGHHLMSDYCSLLYTNYFKNHIYISEWYELQANQKHSKKITYQANEVPLAGVVKGNETQKLYAFMSKMFKIIKIVDGLADDRKAA